MLEPYVQPTINAIIGAARAGEVGDGKIFACRSCRSCACDQQLDDAALTPVPADEVQRRALDITMR